MRPRRCRVRRPARGPRMRTRCGAPSSPSRRRSSSRSSTSSNATPTRSRTASSSSASTSGATASGGSGSSARRARLLRDVAPRRRPPPLPRLAPPSRRALPPPPRRRPPPGARQGGLPLRPPPRPHRERDLPLRSKPSGPPSRATSSPRPRRGSREPSTAASRGSFSCGVRGFSRSPPLPRDRPGRGRSGARRPARRPRARLRRSTSGAPHWERPSTFLPARARLLLRLRFDQELPLEEVARLTGLSGASQVERQVRQALDDLRDAMTARGFPGVSVKGKQRP